MTKKHQEELSAVSEKIYNSAINEIQAYINKTYGNRKENTLENQLEDFHAIAGEVTAALMGNAMAMVDEECWEDELKTLGIQVKTMAAYAASTQKAAMGKKE